MEPGFTQSDAVFESRSHRFGHTSQADQEHAENRQYISKTDIEILSICPTEKRWMIVAVKGKGELKPTSSL